MMIRLTKILMLSMLSLVLVAGTSMATPTLQLDDGSTVITVEDGSLGDINPAADAVTWLGAIGAWMLNVSTGIVYGSSSFPQMDLNSVNMSSTGGSLTISFTETDFDPADFSYIAAIGGTTYGTVEYWLYYDTTNTAFGTENLLAYFGPFSPVGFSDEIAGYFNGDGSPISFTQIVKITHDSAKSSSFDASFNSNPVPEPATLLLLGTGFIGLAGIGRKKFFKK